MLNASIDENKEARIMSIWDREKQFYDEEWKKVQIHKITGKITIPGIENFEGKRVLICSCGTGVEPVLAAKQGAETYAFDISDTAVKNTREMARYNHVLIHADVMDFHRLSYEDNFFDILYGSAILHHIDCEIVGKEIYRVLRPGGIAFFRENSDRVLLFRFLRRLLFGKPGGYQRRRFLFIKRRGTTDEYPLTEKEISTLSEIFDGNIKVYNERFYFLFHLNALIFRNPKIGKILWSLDSSIGDSFPSVKKYSFWQEILLKKPNFH